LKEGVTMLIFGQATSEDDGGISASEGAAMGHLQPFAAGRGGRREALLLFICIHPLLRDKRQGAAITVSAAFVSSASPGHVQL
jgi:hypothetical protein